MDLSRGSSNNAHDNENQVENNDDEDQVSSTPAAVEASPGESSEQPATSYSINESDPAVSREASADDGQGEPDKDADGDITLSISRTPRTVSRHSVCDNESRPNSAPARTPSEGRGSAQSTPFLIPSKTPRASLANSHLDAHRSDFLVSSFLIFWSKRTKLTSTH